MARKNLFPRSPKGFTYLSVIFIIIIIGISLGAIGRYWSTMIKREKEEEILFRGDEIKDAIEAYYKNTPPGKVSLPKSLKDLLKDPRYPIPKRYLRKIYPDPMTQNGEWELILTKNQEIIGVRSKSDDIPLKRKGFSKEYADFSDKARYKEWEFKVRISR